MRSGAYTLQETLTAEAASILKHSLGLARRRGHAQITPLHVAATLLSLPSSSLRNACLKSQQQNNHPLQCRALELCFNVALNRLPTTTTSPLLQPQHVPSLSNALIAALKRAQAHQRRGCIEQNQQQQQQPLLSVKVELDQLILSILDDPSVSRVMREAGFSSPSVKNNLENSSTLINSSSVFYSSPSLSHNHFLSSYGYGSVLFSSQKKDQVVYHPFLKSSESNKEDINLVFDVLLRKKKKNTVIVGDTVSLTEGLVGDIMKRFERGEVPDEMKTTHFVKFHGLGSVSLKYMKKEEVEMNVIRVLKRKVSDYIALGVGAIFYVGDLKWIVDDNDGSSNEKDVVDYVVEEIGKLFGEEGNKNGKIWLVATASYQSYMRCQRRVPTFENQWCLQAVPVPSAGLGLSLHSSSVHDSKMSISQNPSPMLESKFFSNKEEHGKLNCCEECASNYEKEAQLFKPDKKNLLPSWLQSHSTEARQKDELIQLNKKWNRLCQCLHQNKQPQNHWSNVHNHSSNAKIYPYNSSYPYWPNQGSGILPDTSSSISFADSATKPAYSSNLIPRFRRGQQSCTIEFNFNDEKAQKNQVTTTLELDSLKGMEGTEEVKTTLALGNSTFRGSDQKKMENLTLQRDHIYKVLQENVPWQCETVSSIAEALVDSKSSKECATWLFLQGNDSVGKKRLALAIAESVFGSVEMFSHMDMMKRENSETPFSEKVVGPLKTNEKFVVLVENADFGDTLLRKMLADEFEIAKFGTLGQKIFILSNGGSMVNEDQKKDSVMKLVLKISETEKKPTLELSPSSSSSKSPCLGNKRSAELDLFSKIKIPRIEENEGNKKREFSFSRQSSFNNTLDLNMKANEEDYDDNDEGENSPISSDLTRETLGEHLISNESLDSIENLFEFNQSPAKNKEMTQMFMSRVKESFEEVFGNVKFSVQDKVIEEIGVGCGSFTNNMFEKWLKGIFQTSLERVNGGGKNGIVYTLCWGGKEDRKWDSGFMGSCLPKNIQIVNYLMD